MKALALAAVAAMGMTGQAGAAIVRYDYIGAVIPFCYCYGDDNDNWDTFQILEYLIIDESRYPGGKIAGSTLSAEVQNYDDPMGKDSLSVRSDKLSLEWSSLPEAHADDPDFAYFGLIGHSFLSRPVALYNDMEISFGTDGEVVSWDVGVVTGGSFDYYFYGPDGSEGNSWRGSEGTGEWIRTVLSPDIAPVPLPASALLLAAPVLAGAALSRRRSSAGARPVSAG